MPHFSSAVGFGSILHTLGGWKMFVLSAKPTKTKVARGQSWRNHQQNQVCCSCRLFYLYGIISTMSWSPSAPSSLFHGNSWFQPLRELLLWPTGDWNSVLIMSPSTFMWRDEAKKTLCCQHGACGLLLGQHFHLWLRAPTHTSASSFSLAHSQLPRNLSPFEISSDKGHNLKLVSALNDITVFTIILSKLI